MGRDSSGNGASPTPPQLPSAEVALQPTSALSLCPAQDQLSTEVPRVGGKGLGEELLPPPRVLSRRKSVSSWCCVVGVPVLVAVSMGPLPQSNPKWQHDCCETASQAPCAPPRLVSCRAIPLLFPPSVMACVFAQPGHGRKLGCQLQRTVPGKNLHLESTRVRSSLPGPFPPTRCSLVRVPVFVAVSTEMARDVVRPW